MMGVIGLIIATVVNVFFIKSSMFLTASSHGMHGVIVVLDDYFARASQRQWIRILNMLGYFVVAPIGLYIIWTA